LELWLPYGQTEIPVRIPDDNFYRIVEPSKPSTNKTIATLVENSLDNPLGGVRLKDIVKPGAQAGIIVDPIVPLEARREATKTLSTRLSELGVNGTKIFVRKRMAFATPVEEELRQLDPLQNSFSEIGKTTMGTAVDFDPELLTCEVKVMVGLSMPHFATGFTGGPEAVIPSGSSIRSISKNRSLLTKGFPAPLNTRENPTLSDSLEACRLAGPIYSVSFLPDGWGGVAEAVSGELEPVFNDSVARYVQLHSSRLERKLDIVVVSAGNLLGMDLYHAVRVVVNVLGALKRGGTVILVAECSKGIGDPVFLDYARRFPERKDLATELRYRFKLGGHVNLYLKETLEKCRVQLVSVLPELFVRDTFDLKPSQTASEAVQKAIRVEGKESKILVVPRGDFTVPIMET
jgi:nickel-dependent lactate racemase